MRKTHKTSYKPRWENAIENNLSEAELKQLADEMLDWLSSDNKNFWLNDFAAEKMITPSRLKSYSLSSNYFSAIYDICRVIQESRLLKMALYKEVNATPAVFILKSVIGAGDDDRPVDLESAKKQVEEIFE